MELPRPTVVAQSLPRFHDIRFIGRRQRTNIGKSAEKPLEIRDDRRHRGLNQHHLRDQDAIGIAAFSPGQVPPRALVPSRQPILHRGNPFGILIKLAAS